MGRYEMYGGKSSKDAPEIEITAKDIKMAYPELWEQIYQEGKRVGYAERVAEEGKKQEIKKPAPIPQNEDKETKKGRLIKNYRESHPAVSLKDAALAVGKSNPELFR